jgi:hypothetical protein
MAQLTKEQWEKLAMIIENPSKSGADFIRLQLSDSGFWYMYTSKRVEQVLPDDIEHANYFLYEKKDKPTDAR